MLVVPKCFATAVSLNRFKINSDCRDLRGGVKERQQNISRSLNLSCISCSSHFYPFIRVLVIAFELQYLKIS